MHKLQYILNTILNKLLNMCKFSYDSKIFFLLLSYYMYIFYFIVKFVRHIVQLSNFFYYLDQFISGELLHLLISYVVTNSTIIVGVTIIRMAKSRESIIGLPLWVS
jgi:hypothetical protein